MSNFSSAQVAATVVANVTSSSSTSTSSSPSTAAARGGNGKKGGGAAAAGPPLLWEQNAAQLDTWVRTTSTLLHTKIPTKDDATQAELTPEHLGSIWKKLAHAVAAVRLEEIAAVANDDADDGNQRDDDQNASPTKPKFKRRKRVKKRLVDPYNLWVHVKRLNDDTTTNNNNREKDDSDIDVPDTAGGKLSVLSVGGLLNGMMGIEGGITKTVTPSEDSISSVKDVPDAVLPLADMLVLAHAWHRAIQLQVHRDILSSTPRRIQEMLCSDLTDQEFASIRKRIFDTVFMGKGLHVNDPSDADPNLATGPSAAAHDIEKFKKCKNCGNNNQSDFTVDRKNGDVVCANCGLVVAESLMHEGSQFRKFEGEVDRNHHGDAPNPLYSNAHNLSTTLSGVMQTTGAGVGGFRSGGGRGGRNFENIIRNAHAYTEMNISQFGNKDRRTRTGYKDQQKKDAFRNMTHTGDALNLHEAVVQRAKELFAGFRDDRELVQQLKGVVAACLCLAFQELSEAGEQILKAEQGQAPEPAVKIEDGSDGAAAAADAAAALPSYQYNKRAARRNELHHSNLAGKGGLLLDLSSIETKSNKSAVSVATTASSSNNSPTNAAGDACITKPVAKWDLEDCRKWLTEVPRQIAQEWVDAREKKPNGVPAGSLEDLEGELVMHTFTVIEYLENEMRGKQADANGRKVKTPRLGDMAGLGINWQQLDERGAGKKSLPQAHKSKRTAGQILFLLTAKKLGTLIGDPVAGEAINKKFREVVDKQQTLKSQSVREAASRKRMMQMKRKPWLQARMQS